MYFLPDGDLSNYKNNCYEKVQSYQAMAHMGLPVLKSVIVLDREVHYMSKKDEDAITSYLDNDSCIIRYLYHDAKKNVKSGGKSIKISQDILWNEKEDGADYWILEPCRRENNILCCNACLNRKVGSLCLEFLGEGFDISDMNKGIMRSHERIVIPYPIRRGVYGEWWKWAKIEFCTEEEYKESIVIREKKLQKSGEQYKNIFPAIYKAVGLEVVEYIIEWIDRIEADWIGTPPDFYNLSCSFQKDGRKICWDIQTPKGKISAYLKG